MLPPRGVWVIEASILDIYIYTFHYPDLRFQVTSIVYLESLCLCSHKLTFCSFTPVTLLFTDVAVVDCSPPGCARGTMTVCAKTSTTGNVDLTSPWSMLSGDHCTNFDLCTDYHM